MNNLEKLKDKVSGLPDAPGVYVFKDIRGEILYIGKAKSLKRRVQSYFSRLLSDKTQIMVSKIADLEYRLTYSEAQAQLLEASMVKEKQPPYNVSLKDDKSFPLIRITDEEFPIVSIVRRKKHKPQDTGFYFGPYTNARLLRQAVKTIRRIFGFRSCKKMPSKECLYGRLNLCPAPCIGKVNPQEYHENIERIKMFLESKYPELLDELASKMKIASESFKFEEAAKIRDQINALTAIFSAFKPGKVTFNELDDLRAVLNMKMIPNRIEAFDISDISGKEACGSMVSFYKGVPDKNNYRRFRIKTVEGINDYKMLAEVIHRRYLRLINENLPLPDLILVDGGRSHLSVAERELKKLNLSIPLISIAKDRENIYIKNKASPLRLKSNAPALNLIRRIRDEAHRFALSYHHLLRKKKTLDR